MTDAWTPAWPRGVLFDMDGVLTANNGFHREAWRQTARALLNLHLSDLDLDTKVDGGRNAEIIERLTGRAPEAEALQRFHDAKEGLYRDLALGRLREVLGLGAYLDALDARGIPYALVTSADRVNVAYGLDALGLQARFTRRVLGEDVTRGKPHPEPYLRGAELLHLPPEACLVHEDAVSGVRSGVAAGCLVVALSTTQPEGPLLAAGAKLAVPDFASWLALLP